MELRFQLTADEYVHAVREYWRRARRFNRLLIQLIFGLFLVSFDLLVLVIPTIHDKGFAWFAFAFGVFLIFDLYVLVPHRARRLFRRSPNINGEHRMTIDENGIRTVVPNAEENVRWKALQKVYETKQMFLVMYSPLQFYMVPKRVFGAGEADEFRRLLTSKGLPIRA